MKLRLKPVSEQVMVITGASSGIGLVTARAAARRGARIVAVPVHVPPVYSPDSVAAAILHCASTPVRDMFVGSAARVVSTLNKPSPRLTDKLVANTVIPGTHSGKPRYQRDALHEAGEDLRERGDYQGVVRPSLYTHASMHPMLAASALALAGGFLLRGRLFR